MHSAGNLWKLSFAELAQLCHQLAQGSSAGSDPELRDEAHRLYVGWTDALAIDTRQEGAATRQASLALSLRRRTIELALGSEKADNG